MRRRPVARRVDVVERAAVVEDRERLLAAARVRSTTPKAGESLGEGEPVDLDLAVPRNGAVGLRTTCEAADDASSEPIVPSSGEATAQPDR